MSLEPNWSCYRLHTWDVDDSVADLMWKSVTLNGGWVTVRNDCIDFFVARSFIVEFVLRWGDLVTRHRVLDHF